jgi:hypothetical protein
MPITTKGQPPKEVYSWAVLHPDGTVSREDYKCWFWDSLNDWLDVKRQQAAKKAELKLEAAKAERKAAVEEVKAAEVNHSRNRKGFFPTGGFRRRGLVPIPTVSKHRSLS